MMEHPAVGSIDATRQNIQPGGFFLAETAEAAVIDEGGKFVNFLVFSVLSKGQRSL